SRAAPLPPGEARFWLFRVARNLALHELGRRRTRGRLAGALADRPGGGPPTPEATLAAAEAADELRAHLATLPEDQRAALLLRDQEDMTYAEIGRVLGASEGKVRVDVCRARAALRDRWRALDEHTDDERNRIHGMRAD